MHELSLCESTLELLEQQAKQHHFNRITALWLEIGMLSCIEESAVRFSFDIVCKNSVAEGCQLHIIHSPAQAWCWDCSQSIEITKHEQGCPNCNGHNLRVDSGDSFRIKEIEVE